MKVFVAGGSGVLGRASVRALIDAGHTVRATARGIEKTRVVRRLGAEPVDIDLFDLVALRRAVSESEAVVRLTTKIPSLMKMGRSGAWTETNRLRTDGARILVEAALQERVPVYVHESIVFVYRDGGAAWIGEDAPADDAEATPLRAALAGEQEALRFAQAGGRGVVLRFGGFYGPDAPSTLETAQMMRRRMLPQIGSGVNYLSSIHVTDAGRAVAASLTVPSGVYNICDDGPVPFSAYLQIVAQSLGAPRPIRLPGILRPLLFGEVGRYLFRSLRVSNRRFRSAAGWAPEFASVSDGWPQIAAQWDVRAPAAGAAG